MKKRDVLLYIRKTITMLPTVPVLCFGVSLCLIAAMGNDPFTSFQQGISRQVNIPIGTASLLCNIILFIPFIFIDRKMIGSGSIIMCFGIGPFIEIWNGVLMPMFPAEISIAARVGLVLLGTLFIVVSLAWYIPLNVGLQPLDMASLYLGKMVHKSYGIGLMIFNVVAFIFALIMGADWGFGTLVNVVCVGKLIDWAMPIIGPLSCRVAGIPFKDVNKKAEKED